MKRYVTITLAVALEATDEDCREAGTTAEDALRDVVSTLRELPADLMSRGMITGDSPVTVGSYDSSVVEVRP